MSNLERFNASVNWLAICSVVAADLLKTEITEVTTSTALPSSVPVAWASIITPLMEAEISLTVKPA